MAIEKIARICWNTNNWHRPSGSEGKSKTKQSYEKKQGFGHEEWLFDERMILKDGYLYGYLQALLEPKCHKGKVYDIHLFTIKFCMPRLLHSSLAQDLCSSVRTSAYLKHPT